MNDLDMTSRPSDPANSVTNEVEDQHDQESSHISSPIDELRRLCFHGQPEYVLLYEDHLLRHTPTDAIRQLGRGCAPGLRVQFQLAIGPYVANQITLAFVIRQDGQEFRLATVGIPLSNAKLTSKLFDTRTTIDLLDNMLRNTSQESNSSTEFPESSNNSELPDEHFLEHTSPGVVHLQLTTTQIGHAIRKSSDLWQSECLSDTQNAIMQTINDLIDRVEKKSSHVTWSFLLPAPSHWPDHWEFEFNMKDDSCNPFSVFLGGAQNITQLDHTTVDVDSADRPLKPVGPCFTFTDVHHYVTTHIVSLFDAIAMENILSRMRNDITFHTCIIPFPNSLWSPAPDDFTRYGVTADNEPISFLVVHKPTKHSHLLMPNVDERVTLYLDVRQDLHKSPDVDRTPATIKRIAEFIYGQCCAFARHSQVRVAQLRQEHMNSSAKHRSTNVYDDSGKAEPIAEEDLLEDFDEGEALDLAFTQKVVPFLVDYIGCDSIPANILSRYPEASNEELRKYTADVLALDFYPRSDAPIFMERIYQWVKNQRSPPNLVPKSDVGFPFHGRRISQPFGVSTSAVFFKVDRPKQPKWPGSFEAPYIKIHLKDHPAVVSFKGNTDETLALTYNVETEHLIRTIVQVAQRNTTERVAIRAISDCAGLASKSPTYALFQHFFAFQQFPREHMRDLFECFPGVARTYEARRFSQDLTPQLENIRQSRAGVVFLIGYAGTGKTNACCQILVAAQDGGYIPDAGWHNEWNSDRTLSPITMLPPLDPAVQHELDQLDVVPTLRPRETTASKTSACVKISGNVAVAFDPPKGFRPYQVEDISRQKEISNAVLFIAAQNNQADDALARLSAPPFSRDTLRAYSYSLELDNIFRTEPVPPNCLPQPASLSPSSLKLFSTSVNAKENSRHQKRGPATDPRSWSNLAVAFAQKDPEKWSAILEARAVRNEDVIAWQMKKTGAMAEARKLLDVVLKRHQVILVTAVVAAEIANHHPTWSPILVLVDEAGRIPEGLALVPLTKWPGIPCIFSGDPHQFPPVDPTQHQDFAFEQDDDFFEFRPFFNQVGTSLLQRVDAMGSMDLLLYRNHHSEGTCIDFVAQRLFPGKMTVVKRSGSEQADRALQWWRQYLPNTTSTQILIDLKSKEQMKGKSFVNPTEAEFAAHLAVYMINSLKLPRYEDLVNNASTNVPLSFEYLTLTRHVLNASASDMCLKIVLSNPSAICAFKNAATATLAMAPMTASTLRRIVTHPRATS
ncbi:uncharacterized protein MAM_01713 [Metarhizium album ARSEF 1941]|uniref:Uncharacterized protein n=1 Tax=Metarhizium album (strain ARSEF 1941) TaxID=1081103 RepID=A0A0B2X639_METAS|nr:uncharacterized protein MAM_01713 [Metarhizium album ARSEF 1941]KHO00935.1 hypothetical protein MAM_01713 [Metarhizium album ARSEF 1941]